MSENDIGAFLLGALLLMPIPLMILAIVFGKEKIHQRLEGKYILLILIMYILALILPSATFFEETTVHSGMDFWLVGAVFFWILPISLPFYANILFFIILIRLSLGKNVRLLTEITLLLMLSSLLFPIQLAWGYLM